MYKVVRKLNDNLYEEFGTYESEELASKEAQFIKAFLGYKEMYVMKIN